MVSLLVRPVSLPNDMAGLEGLFQLCFETDEHWPIGEHKYLALLRGADTESVAKVVEFDGELVGFSQLVPNAEGVWALELATHPLRRSLGVLDVLVEQAIHDALKQGASSIRMWVYQAGVASHLHQFGFIQERELRQLRIALPIAASRPGPSDAEIRTFVIGVDEGAWLTLNNRAFAAHPENGSWTRKVLEDRIAQPWFDAAGFLVAWSGEQMIGFCWTKVPEDGAGEIYVIAVDPTKSGGGLGRYLVESGLRYLYEKRDCLTGLLYVDADNQRALDLYDGMGFWVDHIDRSFIVETGTRSAVRS